MDFLILLDGEFRSLIRNSLERIISTRFKKDNINKLSLKLIELKKIKEKKNQDTDLLSSLIANQIFLFIQNKISDMKKYVSIIMFILFLNLLIEN